MEAHLTDRHPAILDNGAGSVIQLQLADRLGVRMDVRRKRSWKGLFDTDDQEMIEIIEFTYQNGQLSIRKDTLKIRSRDIQEKSKGLAMELVIVR
jgi:hypothetical protein